MIGIRYYKRMYRYRNSLYCANIHWLTSILRTFWLIRVGLLHMLEIGGNFDFYDKNDCFVICTNTDIYCISFDREERHGRGHSPSRRSPGRDMRNDRDRDKRYLFSVNSDITSLFSFKFRRQWIIIKFNIKRMHQLIYISVICVGTKDWSQIFKTRG